MGRKAGIALDDVVHAAGTVADRDGLAGLTMSAVADELGIRPPSLYNHVEGYDDLRHELMKHALTQLGAAVAGTDISEDPDETLRRLCHVYRQFARSHPGLYEATLPGKTFRGSDDLWETMIASVAPLLEALRAAGLDGDDLWEGARLIRATLHGFVSLEMNEEGMGLDLDVERSYDRLVEMLVICLRKAIDEIA